MKKEENNPIISLLAIIVIFVCVIYLIFHISELM